MVLRLGGLGPRAQLQAGSGQHDGDRRTSAGISAAPPALSLFGAVTRGAKCPGTNTGKESSGDKLYLVDKKTKHVLVGPDESRARYSGTPSILQLCLE